MITLTFLAISLGCVSAVDIEDMNSTSVAISHNSQVEINENDINNFEDSLSSSNEDAVSAITPTVKITDNAHTAESNNIEKGTRVTIDVQSYANYNYHYDSKIAHLYVGGKDVASTTLTPYNYDDNDRRGSFDYTFTTEGTFDVYVVTDAYTGYSESYNSATSNVITYVVGNGGNIPGDNPTPDNPTQDDDYSVSLRIYDAIYPGNSTIYSNGNYKATIMYELEKTGSFSDEILDVYVNGQYINSTNPNSYSTLGTLTIIEDNDYTFVVNYVASVNGRQVNVTSNSLRYVTKDTGGEQPISGDDYSVSLRIYDANYPGNSTIYGNGNYQATIMYELDKSGSFSDEILDVYVNDEYINSTSLNSYSTLGKLTISEDNDYTFIVRYVATVNGKQINVTSNSLRYVTKDTKPVDPTPSGQVSIQIRDKNNPNSNVITINDKYTPVLEFKAVLPDGTILKQGVVISCNGESIPTVESFTSGTWTTVNTGSFMLNETKEYVIKAELKIDMFMSEIPQYDVYSNEITYKITISDETVMDTVSVSVDDVSYPNAPTANVKASKDGQYTITVGTKTYTANVSGGTATVQLDKFTPDTYSVSIESKTNSSVKNSTTFNVNKANPKVTASSSVDGNRTTITVNVANDATGSVNVTVNNHVYQGVISNGAAVVEIPELSPATYPFFVAYSGDVNYEKGSAQGTFTIASQQSSSKMDSKIIVNDKTITEGDRDNVIITLTDINSNPISNAKVNVNIGTTPLTTDSKGQVNVDISSLSAGTHSLSVSFEGDNNYNSSSASATITVNAKQTPEPVDEPVTNETQKDITISVVNTTVYYGGKITVKVADSDGNAIKTGSVKITYEDKTSTVDLNTDGIAQINAGDLGNSSLKVQYESRSISENITVLSTIESSDVKKCVNVKTGFKPIFKDANGNPLANTEVRLIINGNDYNIVTDSNGVAVFDNKLAIANYEVILINPATGENAVANIKVVDRITGNKNIVMDYLDGTKFKVRVYDDNGNPAKAGEIVKIKANGITYKCKTDKNGYAKLNIGLIPKSYKIITTYKGVTKTNTLKVKQVLKAKNIKVSKKKSIKFSATLKWSNGKAIKNKKITFKFKGKTYTAKTNKKGVATITIKNNFKAGSYKMYVVYVKDKLVKTVKITK